MAAELINAAEIAWRVLAAKIGIPATGNIELVSARQAANGQWRAVARIKGARCYMLKFWLPIRPDRAENSFKALASAKVALAGQKNMSSPTPVAWDAATGAVLMGVCSGETLLDVLLQEDPNRMADRLGLVLSWLAALHAGSLAYEKAFEGERFIANIERQSAARDIPEHGTFLACLAALKELSQDATGQKGPTAIGHGDLTLSNILIDEEHVSGIDFVNVNRVFMAKDLAVLLCDIRVNFGQEATVAPYSLLPVDLLGAVTEHYPHIGANSAHLRFFAGVRLLRGWLHTPNAEKHRSYRREHVWTGTRIAAQRLLLGSV